MKRLKILLSNDDGVHAQGINTLFDILKESHDVVMVAPSEERSASGQTLTLDHPVRVFEIAKNKYATSGFPSDCTLLALSHILKEKPDLMISGINHGANLAQDIYYSGTVAAARQASFQGVKSIAVSTVLNGHYHETSELHFESAAYFVKDLVDKEIYQSIGDKEVLNINVPNLPIDKIAGVESTFLGHRNYSEEVEHRLDAKNREYFWLGGQLLDSTHIPGSDCWALANNKISINLLKLTPDFAEERVKWSGIANSL